jgi:DNA-binding NtrC family response regulator
MHPATVLVVADDEAFRMEVCRILRHAGYKVVPASRGIEVQWLADRGVGDLVIAEIPSLEADDYHAGIPLGGWERRIPVILTSVIPRSECIARGLLQLKMPYLHQPFPPRECQRIVRRVIRDWRAPLVA